MSVDGPRPLLVDSDKTVSSSLCPCPPFVTNTWMTTLFGHILRRSHPLYRWLYIYLIYSITPSHWPLYTLCTPLVMPPSGHSWPMNIWPVNLVLMKLWTTVTDVTTVTCQHQEVCCELLDYIVNCCTSWIHYIYISLPKTGVSNLIIGDYDIVQYYSCHGNMTYSTCSKRGNSIKLMHLGCQCANAASL